MGFVRGKTCRTMASHSSCLPGAGQSCQPTEVISDGLLYFIFLISNKSLKCNSTMEQSDLSKPPRGRTVEPTGEYEEEGKTPKYLCSVRQRQEQPQLGGQLELGIKTTALKWLRSFSAVIKTRACSDRPVGSRLLLDGPRGLQDRQQMAAACHTSLPCLRALGALLLTTHSPYPSILSAEP